MYAEYFPFKRAKNDYQPCSFTPIFALQPHMSMYYRKLWAEMLALDIHETFDVEDNVVQTGERLKTTVLQRGSGDVAKELFRRFQVGYRGLITAYQAFRLIRLSGLLGYWAYQAFGVIRLLGLSGYWASQTIGFIRLPGLSRLIRLLGSLGYQAYQAITLLGFWAHQAIRLIGLLSLSGYRGLLGYQAYQGSGLIRVLGLLGYQGF